MQGNDRKAAIAAYKKRKDAVGIYKISCASSGRTWVGSSPNLDTIQNRIWFSLRLGNYRNRQLQEAWQQEKPENFSFEVVETLKEEDIPYVRNALLQERLAYWQSTLAAQPV